MVRGSTVSATTGGRDLDQELPLLVFLHGAALDKTTWQLQTRYFAHHGFSVLAVDLPGHGSSDGPVLGAVEDYADWVAELVVAAGFGEAHLVGHSMGALIVLEAAARHPQRASTLTMCGGAATIRVHPGLLAAAEQGEYLAYELMSSWGHGKPFHLGGHQTPGLWMMGGTIRLWERAPAGVLASDLHACNDYDRGAEAAGRIRCPALLVRGSQDIMTPSRAAAPLREHMADLQEAIIDGAGHIMIVERPDPVIDAIAGFLWGLGSSGLSV